MVGKEDLNVKRGDEKASLQYPGQTTFFDLLQKKLDNS